MEQEIKNPEELLDDEIELIQDDAKRERMRFLLHEYQKPKFRINGPAYTFFITIILCLIWKINQQANVIETQQQDIQDILIYLLYENQQAQDVLEIDFQADSLMHV